MKNNIIVLLAGVLFMAGCAGTMPPLPAGEPNALIFDQYNATGNATKKTIIPVAPSGLLSTGADSIPAIIPRSTFENTGVAASLIAAHEAAENPHPQYMGGGFPVKGNGVVLFNPGAGDLYIQSERQLSLTGDTGVALTTSGAVHLRADGRVEINGDREVSIRSGSDRVTISADNQINITTDGSNINLGTNDADININAGKGEDGGSVNITVTREGSVTMRTTSGEAGLRVNGPDTGRPPVEINRGDGNGWMPL